MSLGCSLGKFTGNHWVFITINQQRMRYYVAEGFKLSKIVTLLDASTFCEEGSFSEVVQRLLVANVKKDLIKHHKITQIT